MTHLREHRPSRNAALLATIAGTAALVGCFRTSQVEPPKTTRHPLVQQAGIPAPDIATITTEALIERHRSDLERLADATRIDDIERGGVILLANGRTELVEIYNDIRDGPELITRYALGAHQLQKQIEGYLAAAVNGRKNSCPDNHGYYSIRENQFIASLNNLTRLTGKERTSQTDQAHLIYSELALHSTYMRNPQEYERVKKRGKILFHVHTHYDGAKHETPPDEDPLRPSRQDLLISEHEEGIVSGVDSTGRRMLYYTHKGEYRVLRPDSAVAMR